MTEAFYPTRVTDAACGRDRACFAAGFCDLRPAVAMAYCTACWLDALEEERETPDVDFENDNYLPF